MWDQICRGRYQDLFWHNNGLYSLKVASIPSTVLEPDCPANKNTTRKQLSLRLYIWLECGYSWSTKSGREHNAHCTLHKQIYKKEQTFYLHDQSLSQID